MKKKKQKKVLIIAAVAIVALVAVIAIFAGGGNDGGPLNTDDAKKVVLSDLGIRESKAESLPESTTPTPLPTEGSTLWKILLPVGAGVVLLAGLAVWMIRKKKK